MEARLELTRQAVDSHFWFRGFRRFVLPAIQHEVAGRTHLTLLDCGCGTGDNLRHLAPYGQAIGVDLSSGGVALARQAGFLAARADIAKLPFASASIDLATSFDVLQCMSGDHEAMREIARVLKPGGTAVMTMAALDLLRGDHSEVWQEHQRYTPASARELVGQAGLTPVRVSFLFASLFPILFLSRTVQRLTRRFRRLSEDSDIHVPSRPVNAVLTWLVMAEASLSEVVPMPVGSSLLVIARKPGVRV